MSTRFTLLHRAAAEPSRPGLLLRTVAGVGITIGTAVAGVPAVQADPSVVTPESPAQTDDPALSPLDTSALPSDADGLLDRLNEVSRQAEATSDAVVSNGEALESAWKLWEQADIAVDTSSAEAEKARAKAEQARGPVTEVSQAMYRGAVVDPVTAAIGATSPQDAIDRRAYGTALSASRMAKVEALQDSLTSAAEMQSRALRTRATADFRLADYGHRQVELDQRTAELDSLKAGISEAVDNMSPDQKQRWIDRNGPIDVDVDVFLGNLQSSAGAISAISGGVVGAAMSKLGAPYSWGAAGPDAFDCSGLMYWAYQQMGMTIPRTSSAQISGGTPVSRADLQPGDIVGYYSGVSHVGMYIGDGKIVHASDYGIPVQVVSVDSMPFAGAARY